MIWYQPLLGPLPHRLPHFEAGPIVKDEPKEKYCNVCCQTKPITAFRQRSGANRKYRQSQCYECEKKLSRMNMRKRNAVSSVRVGEQSSGDEEHDSSAQGVSGVQKPVVNGRDIKGRFAASASNC